MNLRSSRHCHHEDEQAATAEASTADAATDSGTRPWEDAKLIMWNRLSGHDKFEHMYASDVFASPACGVPWIYCITKVGVSTSCTCHMSLTEALSNTQSCHSSDICESLSTDLEQGTHWPAEPHPQTATMPEMVHQSH